MSEESETSSTSAAATSHCSGAKCEKLTSSINASAIVVGVVIPVGVIMLGLAIVLYKVWRRSKKEALEDDDPRFFGESEFLPDFAQGSNIYPASAPYTGNPFDGSTQNLLHPPGQFMRHAMSSQGSVHTSPSMDPFQLPAATDDTETLRHYARNLQSNELDGYQLALSTNQKGSLSRPSSTRPPPIRPYLESNGSFATSQSRFELDTPLTQPHMETPIIQSPAKHKVNDLSLNYSQYDPTIAFPLKQTIHEDTSTSNSTRNEKASYGLPVIMQGPSNSKDGSTVFAPPASTANDSFEFESANKLSPSIIPFEHHRNINDHADSHSKSNLADPSRSMISQDLPIQQNQQKGTVIYSNQQSDSPEEPDETNDLLLPDNSPSERPKKSEQKLQFAPDGDEYVYASQNMDDSNSIDRIKSIYQVYLDRNGTTKRVNVEDAYENRKNRDIEYANPPPDSFEMKDVSFQEQHGEFQIPEQPINEHNKDRPIGAPRNMSFENNESPILTQNNEKNGSVTHPLGSKHTRAVSSIYSEAPSRSHYQRQFNHEQETPLPPLPPQPQEFLHPQEFENVEVLPTPASLPQSTTALSLTYFKKTLHGKAHTLQHNPVNRPFNPVDHPEAYQHSAESDAQGLGSINPKSAILPHHLRQSVSMIHPMQLGQKSTFKPAGSIRQVSNDQNGGLSHQHGNEPQNSRVSGLLEFIDTIQPKSVGVVLPSAKSQAGLRKQLEKSHNYSVI